MDKIIINKEAGAFNVEIVGEINRQEVAYAMILLQRIVLQSISEDNIKGEK